MTQLRKDVLNGWKEIAAYLGRDPRTVERWEKTRSLPVRRHPGAGRATVYALVPELDAWLAAPIREPEQTPAEEQDPAASSTSSLRQAAPPETRTSLGPTTHTPQQRLQNLRRQWAVATTIFALLCLAAGLLLSWHRRRLAEAATNSTSPPRPLVAPSAVAGVEELYLRGSYQAEMRTPDSLRRAQENFFEALRRDPRFAPALAGLASTYILLREYSTVPDREAYQQAKDAATRAVTLDPNLPEAHAVLGFVDFFWDWNSVEAQKEFKTALRLAPNLPLAHHWYGSMLTHQGRYADALRELNLAQHLEPSSSAILTTRALALGLSGHREESSDLLNEAIVNEHDGAYHNPATMHQVMAILSLLPPRDIPRFLAEGTLAAELRQDARYVRDLRLAGEVYRARGERAMWEALLAEERQRHVNDGPTYAIARYEAELGEKDQALNDLGKVFSRHDPAMIGISVDPLLANLRSDLRFEKLRNSMGFGANQL